MKIGLPHRLNFPLDHNMSYEKAVITYVQINPSFYLLPQVERWYVEHLEQIVLAM